MKYFFKYKLIIFDLDNTLILEKDYLFNAYKEISNYIERFSFIDSSTIENYLKNEFINNGRYKLFNKMINHFNVETIEISELLTILRSYTPEKNINLIFKMKQILNYLKNNKINYVILTNGNVSQQMNKVKNIKWDGLLCDVIYANELSPKPDTNSFSKYLSENNIKINKHEILMIGDSIEDQLFSSNYGCDFINVSRLHNVINNL